MVIYIQYETCEGLGATAHRAFTRFIQARLCKIQGLLKDFPTVFKDWKLKKNTDLHIIILLLKC